jgi:aminoglycoside 6'-N-acetyltransferase
VDITFRALQRSDFALLSEWLARPHVRRWWRHDPSSDAVEADFGDGVDGLDPVEYFMVVIDGVDRGFIQRCQFGDEAEWLVALQVVDAQAEAAGIDYFIGDMEFVGRGVGTAMIGAFIADTWTRYPNAPMMLVDVEAENVASWRILEKNGFRRIWSGQLDTDEPAVGGTTVILRLDRPALDRPALDRPA